MRNKFPFRILIIYLLLAGCDNYPRSRFQFSGYALYFENQSMIMYTKLKRGSTVQVNLSNNLDKIIRRMVHSVSADTCVAYLYRIKGIGSYTTKGSIDVNNLTNLNTTSQDEVGIFVRSVNSAVLNKESVCATNK